MMKRLWQSLAAILIPVGVTGALFGGSELLLRIFRPQDVRIESSQSLGVRDAAVGHTLRPTNRMVERGPEFTAEYVTNSQGLRDEAIYGDFPPDGRTRVLLVGDSFTFGQGVNYDEAWPTLLERGLRAPGRNVEIVKAGVPAYDTRTVVLQMRGLISVYHPSVVVMGFLPNDLFTNLPLDDTSAATQEAVRETEQTVARAHEEKSTTLHVVTFAQRVLMKSDYLYCTLYGLTARKEYFAQPLSEHVSRQVRTTRALLEAAKETCDQQGARLVVVSIPQQFQVLAANGGHDGKGLDPFWIDREFGEHSRSHGYAWVATLGAFCDAYRKSGDDLYYRLDGHLTVEGNKVLAEFLVHNVEWLNGGPGR